MRDSSRWQALAGLLAVVLLAALAWGCGGDGERGGAAARPHLAVEVAVGVEELVVDGAWTLVRVSAENRGGDFRGTLELTGLLVSSTAAAQAGGVLADPSATAARWRSPRAHRASSDSS
jgi:hypothetical protein